MVMIETDELGPHEMSPERWPVDKRRKYAISMILRVKREFQDDIERSLAYIDKVKNLGIWKWANAESLDEYIATGGLTPDDIEYYRVGVSRLRGEGHQGKITQRDIGRALAESVEPVADHRRPTKDEQSVKGDNITFNGRGTNAEYTAARLKRDHPELLDRVKDGDLTLNQAAIQAGFRRRTISVRIDDPVRLVSSLQNNMTKKQWSEFSSYVVGLCQNQI